MSVDSWSSNDAGRAVVVGVTTWCCFGGRNADVDCKEHEKMATAANENRMMIVVFLACLLACLLPTLPLKLLLTITYLLTTQTTCIIAEDFVTQKLGSLLL